MDDLVGNGHVASGRDGCPGDGCRGGPTDYSAVDGAARDLHRAHGKVICDVCDGGTAPGPIRVDNRTVARGDGHVPAGALSKHDALGSGVPHKVNLLGIAGCDGDRMGAARGARQNQQLVLPVR